MKNKSYIQGHEAYKYLALQDKRILEGKVLAAEAEAEAYKLSLYNIANMLYELDNKSPEIKNIEMLVSALANIQGD